MEAPTEDRMRAPKENGRDNKSTEILRQQKLSRKGKVFTRYWQLCRRLFVRAVDGMAWIQHGGILVVPFKGRGEQRAHYAQSLAGLDL